MRSSSSRSALFLSFVFLFFSFYFTSPTMSSDDESTNPAKDVGATPNSADEAGAAGQGEFPAEEHEKAAPLSAVAKQREPHTAPSPADSRSEEGEARSDDSPDEGGQRAARDGDDHAAATAGDAPPLPAEAPPGQDADDGWSAQWDAANQTWYFYNRFTGVSQWDNPRQPSATTATAAGSAAAAPPIPQISQPASIAGGYNPAIHGSWDPNASYAQAYRSPDATDDTTAAAIDDEAEYQADLAIYHAEMQGADPTAAAAGFEYAANAAFNKRTGKTQAGDQNPERHSDASKSYRQMNAYFNVDQAANSHDGRSLKAERRGKQPTRKELSMWKEKRKARKEEKRRAWLRD